MPKSNEWKFRFEQEINRAAQARLHGNEGMARVCARRAVGIAIGEYLGRQGYEAKTPSAIDRLRFLTTLPDLPQRTKTISEHFLLHINEDYNLPDGIDLISEAYTLVESLLE